jgi:hypothetical protein
MVPPPKKQLRWGLLSFAIVLLVAILGGGVYGVMRLVHH